MLSRKVAFALFAGFALVAAGCGSNNKGKIEGKWKITQMPEKSAKGKDDVAELNKLGLYVYMDFKPDGNMAFGIGADKPEMMEFLKMGAPDKKLVWDAKYKLLSGDGVEIYDMPKEFQEKGGGGLFGGGKDRARVKVKINGTEMKMTDDDGTATLTKLQ